MPAAGSANTPRFGSDGADCVNPAERSKDPACPCISGRPGAGIRDAPDDIPAPADDEKLAADVVPGETRAPTMGADGGMSGLAAGDGDTGRYSDGGMGGGIVVESGAAAGGGANRADRRAEAAGRNGGATAAGTGGAAGSTDVTTGTSNTAAGVSGLDLGTTASEAAPRVPATALTGAVCPTDFAAGVERTGAECAGACGSGDGTAGEGMPPACTLWPPSTASPEAASPEAAPSNCAVDASSAPDRNKRSVTRSTRWAALGVSMTYRSPRAPNSNDPAPATGSGLVRSRPGALRG